LSDASLGQGVALGLLRAITQLALDEPVAYLEPLKLSDASLGQGVALGLLRAITQLALDEPVAYLVTASPLMRFVLGLFPLGLV
jgi:hypothetical protein